MFCGEEPNQLVHSIMKLTKRPLTILVTPVDAVGHINACAGALNHMLKRGHRVIFVLEKACAGKVSPLSYEEFLYTAHPFHQSKRAKKRKLSLRLMAQKT